MCLIRLAKASLTFSIPSCETRSLSFPLSFSRKEVDLLWNAGLGPSVVYAWTHSPRHKINVFCFFLIILSNDHLVDCNNLTVFKNLENWDREHHFLAQAFKLQKHLEVFKQMETALVRCVEHVLIRKHLQQDAVTKNWGKMAAIKHLQCALFWRMSETRLKRPHSICTPDLKITDGILWWKMLIEQLV